MQKSIFILCFSLVFHLFAVGQVDVKDIQFVNKTIDFGRIYVEAGVVTAEYKFKNNGTATFEISEIDAACGCTNPRASSYSVAPGEEAKILAEFNPKGMLGEVDKWIYVRGNFDNEFQIRLNFTADVKSYERLSDIQHYPGEFGYLILERLNVSFGVVSDLRLRLDSIKVTNEGDKPLQVESINGLPGFISVSNLPLSVEPNESGYLKFKIDATKSDTVGPYMGQLKVNTNDRFFPLKTISYRLVFQDDFSHLSKRKLKKAPRIELSTTEIDFGTMGSGAVKKMPVEISNTGKSPLIIRRIDAACACAILSDLKEEIAPGETIKVMAQFDALYKHGNQRKTVILYTNDPNNPQITLFLKTKIK